MATSKKPNLEPMLNELRDILLNNSDFPDEKKFNCEEMKANLLEFKKMYEPKYSRKVDIGTVQSFIRKYKFFELYKWYLNEFQNMGARAILIEGADAVGKTSLIEPLSGKIGAVPIENQSGNLFYKLFKLPRQYKIVVSDYNDNVAVGLLFYMCMNLMTLEKAFVEFKKGRKYVVIDSSLIRTFASRIAIPTVGKDDGLHIDRGIYKLVKDKLNVNYINTIKSCKRAMFFIFMYASDGVRKEQAKAEKGREYLHYESNKKYAKFVDHYLRWNQAELRKLKVPMVSMLLAIEHERGKAEKIRSRVGIDAVLIRTDSKSADVRKKVNIIVDALKENSSSK